MVQEFILCQKVQRNSLPQITKKVGIPFTKTTHTKTLTIETIIFSLKIQITLSEYIRSYPQIVTIPANLLTNSFLFF